MPVQQSKSASGLSLAKKLGSKLVAAHQAVAGNEYKASAGGDLPEGITNGIAKLTSCKFGEFKEGKNVGQVYFMGAGIVVDVPQPELKWAVGLRTQVGPIPLCPTTAQDPKFNKTLEENLDKMYNVWRGLGVNVSAIDPTMEGELERTAKAMEEAGIYFRFRTWKGKATTDFPDPRVNHDWGKACEYSEGETSPTAGVVDETEQAPPPPPAKAAPAASKAPAKPPAKPPVKVAPAPDPDPVGYSDAADIDSLAVTADDGSDEDAQAQAQASLKEQAMALGHAEDAVDSCGTWAEVVELIKGGAPVAEEPEPETKWKPAKDDVYLFADTDPKTKKLLKPAEWQVTAVDEKKRTVTIKNVKNAKQTKAGVAWEKLEAAS